jgi:NAD(P)-dependent dehydrogenase (short-subunit alcohol dehydrogenase family)
MSTTNWTTNNIPSLTGKTIIVTGGNSGLGFQSVKAYAEKGAQVIMASRSLTKGENAKSEILKNCKEANIVVMQLDLTDLASVRQFAEEFNKKYERLDILLNNAGIMMGPYALTKDGIEAQQGTNHFGHFALTGLLLDKLKTTPKSRVVNVSSLAHRQGVMDFDNLLYEGGKDYSPLKAYGRSKLENLLFTLELQRYFESKKLDIIAVVAHPGVSDTNLFVHMGGQLLQTILRPLFKIFIQPASMGALPQLRASVDTHVKGGEFYGPNGPKEMKGYPIMVKAMDKAYNKESARKLWEFSEKTTGVKF